MKAIEGARAFSLYGSSLYRLTNLQLSIASYEISKLNNRKKQAILYYSEREAELNKKNIYTSYLLILKFMLNKKALSFFPLNHAAPVEIFVRAKYSGSRQA
ncbi:hypothetical protein SAMN05660816_04421 [Niastella yeongjuensis]|nr:hypothetical protein SAMN05660816_04421 [Niastella yeongjuensis]